MPVIGEVRKAHEIGYKRTEKFIWVACEVCGKERWVRFRKGQPKAKKCADCHNKRQGSYYSASEKLCPHCQQVKLLEDFHVNRKKNSGRGSWCKTCIGIYVKRRHKEDPERKRFANQKRLYGVTREEYEKMLAEQGGVCAICKGRNNSGKHFFVDHDHDTLKIRGLLCISCNSVIGLAHDNLALLQRAIYYLEKSR